MFDILDFIDSQAIREYNQETCFNIAEQAILIAESKKKKVTEKLEALQELVEKHSEEEFSEAEKNLGKTWGIEISFRTAVLNTIQMYTEVLQARFKNERMIYAACLEEKECRHDDMTDHLFFSSYEKAYEYLKKYKQEYMEDEDLSRVQFFGKIYRIRMDEEFKVGYSHRLVDCDEYYFNHDLELVNVVGRNDRIEGDFEEYSDLTSRDWSMFIPLPFKNGDIVKVADPFRDTYYGVFVGEWKRPDKHDQLSMTIGIDVYIAENGKDRFDCTDDTEILCLEYCKDEELPRNQNVLKLLRDVRKGKKDLLSLLYNFGKLQEFAGDFC